VDLDRRRCAKKRKKEKGRADRAVQAVAIVVVVILCFWGGPIESIGFSRPQSIDANHLRGLTKKKKKKSALGRPPRLPAAFRRPFVRSNSWLVLSEVPPTLRPGLRFGDTGKRNCRQWGSWTKKKKKGAGGDDGSSRAPTTSSFFLLRLFCFFLSFVLSVSYSVGAVKQTNKQTNKQLLRLLAILEAKK
jgi:hypothetical protein